MAQKQQSYCACPQTHITVCVYKTITISAQWAPLLASSNHELLALILIFLTSILSGEAPKAGRKERGSSELSNLSHYHNVLPRLEKQNECVQLSEMMSTVVLQDPLIRSLIGLRVYHIRAKQLNREPPRIYLPVFMSLTVSEYKHVSPRFSFQWGSSLCLLSTL